MRVLITGANGFLGQELAAALLCDPALTHLVLTDTRAPTPPTAATSTYPVPASASSKTTCVAADLTDAAALPALLATPFDSIYVLHGIMSSGSEANLDLGLAVNWDSTRGLAMYLASNHPEGAAPTKLVYTSACAIYGPQAPGAAPVTERTTPQPQSSYGSQKLMAETLLADLSRRGRLDARCVRLPTIVVRPGAPTAAASSFASGIIREPLRGVDAELPVRGSLRLWVCSARVVVENLLHAGEEVARETGGSRVVNLPGRTVSVEEMLAALERVGGKEARARVKEVRDEAVERIVESWATEFETGRASALGFRADQGLEETVRDFVRGYVERV